MNKLFPYLRLTIVPILLLAFSTPAVCFVFPKPFEVYHATLGSEITLAAADIDGIETFCKKPVVYLIKPTTAKRTRKTRLKVVSHDQDSVTCLLNKSLPAGVYELWIQEKIRGEKPDPILLTNNFEIRPPSLHELEGDPMVEGQSLVLKGSYFTSKIPRIWIQYVDPKTGKLKKIRAKIDKNKLKYRFQGQMTPMNARTGASQLTFSFPKVPAENAESIQIHCATKHGTAIYIHQSGEPVAGQLISATKLNQSTFELILETLEKMAKADAWWEYVIDVIELFYESHAYSTLDCYQLIYYTTNPLGGLQTVSGVVFIPKDAVSAEDAKTATDTFELPFLSMHHGTMVDRSDSPSLNLMYAEDIFGQLYAWKGYIVAMADYPGLGVNHDQQPYCNYAVTNSTVDMLKVTKTFVANHYSGNARWNGKLSLIGYSEGGYVTMATGNVLQKNYPTEFPVTACAPLEGPYSLSNTMLGVMRSQAPFKAPYFLPVVLNGYDAVYKQQTTVFDIMNSVKASIDSVPSGYNTQLYDLINGIAVIPDGETYSEATNAWMAKAMQDPTTYNAPRDVLSAAFAELLDKNEGVVFDTLKENDSFRDWVPTTMQMKLFHCEQDDLVLVGNAQVAYQGFLDQGASPDYLQTPDIYSIQLLLDLFKIIDEKLLEKESIHVINAPFGFLKGIAWVDEEMKK